MGKPAPTIYDPMCSVYVLESGEAMLRAHQAQAAEDGRPTPVMYLSTTDFVQHKYEPEEPEALDFYSGVDAAIGALFQFRRGREGGGTEGLRRTLSCFGR